MAKSERTKIKTAYRIIHPNREVEIAREVILAEDPSLQELRDVVIPEIKGCVHFERVRVLDGELITDMFVDEDGVAKGLRVNLEATRLYRAQWMEAHPNDDPEKLPKIYGTAVVFARRVWF